ncbi:MAG: hypothetical protein J6B06_06275 [Lachnospiraceae bacterium]|nr:hypothetical protein [Lachnospiraceae bacterium]
MKKFLIGIICIGFIVFLGVTAKQTLDFLPDEEQAICVEGEDGAWIIAERRGLDSYLYQMDENGKITRFYALEQLLPQYQVLDICVSDSYIYLVCQGNTAQDDESYSLVRLDAAFNPDFVYECAEFSAKDHLSSLYVENNYAYLTFLSQYRDKAMVYSMNLKEADKVWKPVLMREAGENRTYTEAVYREGRLEVCLDDGTWGSYEKKQFEEIREEDVLGKYNTEAFSGEKLSANLSVYMEFMSQILYRNFMCYLLFIALFGLPMLGIINRHSYALQRFSVMEMVLIAVLLLGTCFSFWQIKENRQADRMKYARSYITLLETELGDYSASLSQENLYETEQYSRIHSALMTYMEQEGNQNYISGADILSWQGEEPYVVVSALHSAGQKSSDIYGREFETRLLEVKQKGGEMSGVQTVAGEECGIFVISARDKVIADYALVVTVPLSELEQYEIEYRNQLVRFAVAVFFVGTVLLAGITWILSASMQRFSKTMEAVARGERSFQKPSVDSDEMNLMWNSLSEINKNVEQVEYTRFKIYQAYSRFAPQQIETILGRDSIVDVRPGDFKMIDAMLGIISLDEMEHVPVQEYQERINSRMQDIACVGNEQKGILVDADSRLTNMKLLFIEKPEQAVTFGIDVMHTLESKNSREAEAAAFLLHKSEYVYGVSGTEQEPVTYLTSEDMCGLQEYVKKLRQHGIRMTVTETVLPYLDSRTAIRYIGFWQQGQENTLKLYEVLDAYGEKERRCRMEHDVLFQKAIELYYKNDFYLARNTFTEIVKSAPSDQVAKWYLFTCENHLNETYNENIQYGLFAE